MQVVAIANTHADDSAVLDERAVDERAELHGDVVDTFDSTANVGLELGTGLDVDHGAAVDGHVSLEAVRLPHRGVGVEVTTELQLDRPRVDEIVDEAGEPLGHRVGAAGQQHVEVVTLWHHLARRTTGRLVVAIDDNHLVEVIAEHTGGEESSHPATDHHCSLTEVRPVRHAALPCVVVQPTVCRLADTRKRRRSHASEVIDIERYGCSMRRSATC